MKQPTPTPPEGRGLDTSSADVCLQGNHLPSLREGSGVGCWVGCCVGCSIRAAQPSDAEELLAIYAPYVELTAITFEYDVPTLDEFRQRMAAVSKRYPWLVAVDGQRIVGYAYASPFKERAAYQWAVETSIYVDSSQRGRGIGRQLHQALEEALRQQGILNMNACIAYTDHEDEHLTLDSVRFHQRLGYAKVAHFHKCGKKFNRWYDMIWMEKIIGSHP